MVLYRFIRVSGIVGCSLGRANDKCYGRRQVFIIKKGLSKSAVLLPALLFPSKVGFTDISPRTEPLDQPVEPLIEDGSKWRYRTGKSGVQIGDWTSLDFNQEHWPTGNASFGYGYPDTATQLRDMRRMVRRNGHVVQERYLTAYLRKRFSARNVPTFQNLYLELKYDDGFVVYLNEVEVARRFMGQSGARISSDTPASAPLFRDWIGHEAREFEWIEMSSEFLKPGENVLAVEVHNRSLYSSDLSFDCALVGQRQFRRELDGTLGDRVSPLACYGRIDYQNALLADLDGDRDHDLFLPDKGTASLLEYRHCKNTSMGLF